jgi:hypothetical protein
VSAVRGSGNPCVGARAARPRERPACGQRRNRVFVGAIAIH